MQTPEIPKPTVLEVAIAALFVAGLVFTDLFLSDVPVAVRTSAAGVGFAGAFALGLMMADRRR